MLIIDIPGITCTQLDPELQEHLLDILKNSTAWLLIYEKSIHEAVNNELFYRRMTYAFALKITPLLNLAFES